MKNLWAQYGMMALAGLSAVLLVLLVVQTVRIEGFKIWPISHSGLKADLKAATDKLDALESQGREKQTQVREVIKAGKDRIVYVTREAERIENAPLPGGCKTPELVMGADL